jgi:hypothetical protein
VGRVPEGVIVKTGDTTVRVTHVADVVDEKLENERNPSIRIGTVFS